jgi:hypothetical protein
LPALLTTLARKVAALAALAQMALALGLHLALWNVYLIERQAGPISDDYTSGIVPLAERTLNSSERIYVASVSLSALATVLTAVVFVWLYLRLSKQQPKEPGQSGE